jgi:hypothetical protein
MYHSVLLIIMDSDLDVSGKVHEIEKMVFGEDFSVGEKLIDVEGEVDCLAQGGNRALALFIDCLAPSCMNDAMSMARQ